MIASRPAESPLNRTDGVLDTIVGELQFAIFQEGGQLRPERHSVTVREKVQVRLEKKNHAR